MTFCLLFSELQAHHVHQHLLESEPRLHSHQRDGHVGQPHRDFPDLVDVQVADVQRAGEYFPDKKTGAQHLFRPLRS